MQTVRFFRPTDEFQKQVQSILKQEVDRIAQLIPQAKIDHVGATSVSGAVTKGDVDIQVQVPQDRFDEATLALKSLYEINQPENWSVDFASFREAGLLPLPLGIQLVVAGSKSDCFAQCRDLLMRDPQQLRKLNALKWQFHGKSMEAYRVAKGQFFEQLLSTTAN